MKLTDISTIKAICDQFGFSFKKKFGQNFIISDRIPAQIAAIAAGRNALEIGPGIGTLTSELCKVCEKVAAVEIDRSLMPVLETTVGEYKNIKVIFDDIMKTDIAELCQKEFENGEICVCANLPYYITTPVLLRLLESGVKFKSITVMVQKEVADRLCASAGTPEYGAITLACARYGKVKKLFDVPKSCFYPVPGVDSAVVSVIPDEKEEIFVKDEALLTKIIRASFNQRRKTFINAISGEFPEKTKCELAELLVSRGFREDIRGEKLSLADFARISNALADDMK